MRTFGIEKENVNKQKADVQVADGGLGEILRLSGPVILSRLGIMTMGLTDAIVVGHYSSVELGYHALGWAPTMVVLTTAIGLLTGIQVLTAQLIGERRPTDTGAVLRRGLIFSLVIGIVSGALLHFGAAPFMHVMGLEASLADGASRVARVFAWSMPAFLLSTALTIWLEALEKPVPAMLLMGLANIVNIAANLWLVPGTSPFAIDGAVASAVSTFSARAVLVVTLFAYVLWWPRARNDYGVFSAAPDAPSWRALARIGIASAGSLFVESGAFAGMNIIAGLISGIAAAAWSIVLNVTAVVFMIPLGLAAATAVLVGRGYGERSLAHIRRSGMLGFALSFAALTIISVLIWGFADIIVAAYTSDPALTVLAVPALLLSCLFFTADGLQVVAANALRARNDVWLPTLTHTISYGCVMLPLGWFLALQMGLGIQGIVWAVILASLLAAGFLLARFWWLSRPLSQ